MSKRLLELFCGTKSVGKEFQKVGYEVVSLDYNKKFNATHTVDILTWDYKQYEPDYFNVIWASPDCTTFSLATGGKYRTKDMIYGKNNEFQERATLGNNMILRLIEILKYFKCNCWFVENPRGLLQHFPPLKEFIKEVNANMNLVYYGNYNWGFPKATNIWSNLPLWENEKMPVMSEDTYKLKHHNYNNRPKKYYYAFYDKNAEERSKIPADLINKLMGLIKN
tara:strand:+ start:706 stop:1374 length:669 start_codon:yes stop_codon:yes gene_type:complete